MVSVEKVPKWVEPSLKLCRSIQWVAGFSYGVLSLFFFYIAIYQIALALLIASLLNIGFLFFPKTNISGITLMNHVIAIVLGLFITPLLGWKAGIQNGIFICFAYNFFNPFKRKSTMLFINLAAFVAYIYLLLYVSNEQALIPLNDILIMRIHIVFYTALASTIVLGINMADLSNMFKKNQDDVVKNHYATLAYHDSLTGLYNRRGISQVLIDKWEESIKEKEPFYVVMGDIDNFKQVNDGYGHWTGDEVLKLFALVAKKTLRQTEEIGRWGGDEFIVVIDNVPTIDMVEAIMVRVKDEVEKYIVENNFICPFTMSFGIASSKEKKDLNQLLVKADELMYEAKAKGRNSIVVENGDN